MKRMVCAAGTALMVCCMAGSTVSAAPVSDIEQQKSAAESEAESLQKQLMELLSQVDEMEAKLIATGEEITQTEADLAATREQAPAEIPEQHPAAPEAIVPAADLPVHPAEILLWPRRL